MISPFKAAVGGDYKVVEHRLQVAIHLRFGLPATVPAALKILIKRADQIAAYLEATPLAGFSEKEAAEFFGRPRGLFIDRFELTPMPALAVQQAFLQRYAAISRHGVSAVALG
jgi:5'-deoxynucleotidase YfbR-like HD superfamily hydrolase